MAQFGVVCVCARGNRIEGKTIRENLRAITAEKSVFCSFVIYLVLILNHSVSLNYTLIHRRESERARNRAFTANKNEQRQAKTLHNPLKVSRSVQKSKQKQKKKMGKLNKT